MWLASTHSEPAEMVLLGWTEESSNQHMLCF